VVVGELALIQIFQPAYLTLSDRLSSEAYWEMAL